MLYKTKLFIIISWYGDLEKRLLEYFAKHPEVSEVPLTASKENEIQLMYVVREGLIRSAREVDAPGGDFVSGYKHAYDELTPHGKEFIKKWLSEVEELQ